MEFREKIKLICEREEIKLKEFSELANISYGVMTKYSGGTRNPNLAQINKMTEHPRLAKYRGFLLGTDDRYEPIGEDPEIMALIRRCEELGIADEAADVIRALLKTAERD